jgi:hypothetical protein
MGRTRMAIRRNSGHGGEVRSLDFWQSKIRRALPERKISGKILRVESGCNRLAD